MPFMPLLVLVFVLALLFLSTINVAARPVNPLTLVFTWVAVVSMFIGASRLDYYRTRRRLLRTLEAGTCPACGYELAHVPPAFPSDKLPGAGPVRCTECASPWPLVPPPPAW